MVCGQPLGIGDAQGMVDMVLEEQAGAPNSCYGMPDRYAGDFGRAEHLIAPSAEFGVHLLRYCESAGDGE